MWGNFSGNILKSKIVLAKSLTLVVSGGRCIRGHLLGAVCSACHNHLGSVSVTVCLASSNSSLSHSDIY